MTFSETASAMRKVADAIDRVSKQRGSADMQTGLRKPMLEGELAAGAGAFLCYLRDLITCGERETYDRGTLLVLLETCSNDSEMLGGVGRLMWGAEDPPLEDDPT